jgi:predicted Zn-ribbon and HTH transcriptional regulator
MIDLLVDESLSDRDLSQMLGIKERDVYDHLSHIERSAAARGLKMTIIPPECLACGYVFKDRRRFTRPGRCPRCKQTRIQRPLYRIES